MSIRFETCGLCNGRPMERLEERTSAGDWVPNDDPIIAAMADAWIAQDKCCPVRWAEVTCPRCGGEGSYAVEHFTCKIF